MMRKHLGLLGVGGLQRVWLMVQEFPGDHLMAFQPVLFVKDEEVN